MLDVLGVVITLISFYTALLAAKFIYQYTPSLHSISNRQARFVSLDGLRGYLAFAVFFHHYVITWYWKVDGDWSHSPQVFFQNYGRVGVAIFFIITGFLFISKIIQSNGKPNWLKLYESRIYRILPLYLFTIGIITFIVFSSSNYKINVSVSSLLSQYFNWVIFNGDVINGFSNTRKVIAGVDWSLKYEWIFYLSLPILAAILFKLRKTGGALLFFICAFLFLYPQTFQSFSTSYLIFFAFGGLTAAIINLVTLPDNIIKGKIVSGIVTLAVIFTIFYPKTLSSVHIAIIFVTFVLVALGNDMFGIFSSKSSILLGEISYSIYLLHGVVLYLAFTYLGVIDFSQYTFQEYMFLMPLLSIIVVMLSFTTFIFIERPGINYGRKYYLTKALSMAKNSSVKM